MGRFFGYLFSALALAAFAYDIWRGPMRKEDLVFTSTGEFWAEWHRASLIGFNSFIEKSITPDLWDLVVLPAITWPAFVLMAVFALFFFVISRRKSRNGRIFPR